MAWVRFSRDFDFRGPSWVVAYRAGGRHNLPRAHKAAATAAGAAEAIRAPSKAVAARLKADPHWSGDAPDA
jgi:hypothetical protein